MLNAVTEKTCLVSIMHANNEIGTLQPIAAISAALRKRYEAKTNTSPHHK